MITKAHGLSDGAVASVVSSVIVTNAVTSSAAELNILDGATLTVTELNYVDGVTSEIQTQLDSKITSSSTTTLTNKRITKRVVSVADATSITLNSDTSDIVSQTNTQAAGTLTINAPSGTPTDGQPLVIRVISTNSQTNSWNAAYSGNLPGSTAAGTNYYAFIYYAAGTVWHYTGGAGI